jgi:hypothetical protein
MWDFGLRIVDGSLQERCVDRGSKSEFRNPQSEIGTLLLLAQLPVTALFAADLAAAARFESHC